MTERITPEELTRLRGLESQATPGEWLADDEADILNTDDVCLLMTTVDNCNPIQDIEFIAALRNAAPALLDEIERLRAENDQLMRDDCISIQVCKELSDEIERLRAELDSTRQSMQLLENASSTWKESANDYHDQLDEIKQLDIDIRSLEPFAELTPEAMRRYLEEHGWRYGGTGALVAFWNRPDDGSLQVLLPHPKASDYARVMKRAVECLCEHEGRSQLAILDDLKGME